MEIMKNGLIIDKDGTKEYYKNDLYHREDGPAIEHSDGSKFWWLNGKPHRVDGPAEEWESGAKRWYLHGKIHRVDGPAEEYANGHKEWYYNNERLIHPKEFKNMEAFIEKLSTDENYSFQWINVFNGLIEYINKPTPKQKRLHAMKWKI